MNHWIAVRGPARAKDMERMDDDHIVDAEVLRKFDGVTDPDEFALAASMDFAPGLQIRGGVVTTVFDAQHGLEVESRFTCAEVLNDGLVARLLDETLSQWSDGVGSGNDIISGLPFRACPDRDLVLSVWEDGDTYRLLTSWSPAPRTFAWELKRDDAGRPFRAVRFLE